MKIKYLSSGSALIASFLNSTVAMEASEDDSRYSDNSDKKTTIKAIDINLDALFNQLETKSKLYTTKSEEALGYKKTYTELQPQVAVYKSMASMPGGLNSPYNNVMDQLYTKSQCETAEKNFQSTLKKAARLKFEIVSELNNLLLTRSFPAHFHAQALNTANQIGADNLAIRIQGGDNEYGIEMAGIFLPAEILHEIIRHLHTSYQGPLSKKGEPIFIKEGGFKDIAPLLRVNKSFNTALLSIPINLYQSFRNNGRSVERNFDDEGLAKIIQLFPNIQFIRPNNKLLDNGFQYLAKLPQLKHLDLTGFGINPNYQWLITHLSSLKSLKKVDLGKDSLTSEHIEKLKKDFPKITFNV